MRSRWVARDFKPKGDVDRADLFAAMRPLEAKRMLFRRFADKRNLEGKKKMKLMLIDVKKAHTMASASVTTSSSSCRLRQAHHPARADASCAGCTG